MDNACVSDIGVDYPDSDDLHLRIGVGACQLRVAPSEGDKWVSGTYYDPSEKIPPKIVLEGGGVRIGMGQSPTKLLGLLRGIPKFDLALGKSKEFGLTIESGASDNSFEFGGLPITDLLIKQGAGRVDLNFSSPNPQSMSTLKLTIGACAMDAKNLLNAHFSEMIVEGGAASYKFDFGGALMEDAHVKIATGASALELLIPSTTATKISADYPLGNLDVGDGFMTKEGLFWNIAALEGSTPLLSITTSVALGSLRLRST